MYKTSICFKCSFYYYSPGRETFRRQTTTKKEKPRTALFIKRFYGIAIGLPCNDTNLMHAVLGQLKELRTGFRRTLRGCRIIMVISLNQNKIDKNKIYNHVSAL